MDPLYKLPYQQRAADLVVNARREIPEHPRFKAYLGENERLRKGAEVGCEVQRELERRIRAFEQWPAAIEAWEAEHGHRDTVVVLKDVPGPFMRNGLEVWPSDSEVVLDPEVGYRRVRRFQVHPPKKPANPRVCDLAVEVKTWSEAS
ncbi:hypothetical protein [Nocardioides alcanivorans]|uniref:hypothetical protein n=1 Tax=Nocardioides alcanivorans TaxID=2897352 RepID=UPI001F1666E2|nr:hypothetical protein [Nocardioides alcanivorans]